MYVCMYVCICLYIYNTDKYIYIYIYIYIYSDRGRERERERCSYRYINIFISALPGHRQTAHRCKVVAARAAFCAPGSETGRAGPPEGRGGGWTGGPPADAGPLRHPQAQVPAGPGGLGALRVRPGGRDGGPEGDQGETLV